MNLTSSYSFLDPSNWSNAQRGQFSSLPDLLQESRAILTWREQKLFKRAKMQATPGSGRSGDHEHTLT